MTAKLDAGALRLLASGALAVALIGLLLLFSGANEQNESRAWIVAFALALPGGLWLATRQERRLASAAPAAASRGLAGGLMLLAVAFLFRRAGTGDGLHHLILVLAALGALVAPLLAARLWVDPADSNADAAYVMALLALVFLLLLFVPRRALLPGDLLPALALAAAAVAALRLRRPPWLSGRRSAGLDLGACLFIALIVVQLPELLPYTGNLQIHHLYFLGPANDVVHGRAMLGTAWSQYGVGLLDGLGLVFKILPAGFGTLALLVAILTALQYICVYVTLRLAGLGFVLALLAVAVAALGNLFATLEAYVVFPSTSPLRFGVPYLIVFAAVLGAHAPRWRKPSRVAVLVFLALAATLSFETFAYSAGTYGALVLVEEIAAGSGAWRRVLRAALLGVAVATAAVVAFSFLTLALTGHLDWGPYFEYLTLYSSEGFFGLRIFFFSAGPLMGALLFMSAVALLWLVQAQPTVLPSPLRTALAGFTGFAIVAFTYYLGRSHPNNLLVLLVPVVAIAALWIGVLFGSGEGWWRTGVAGALALAMAMIALASWPGIEDKGRFTALGLLAPGGRSLSGAATTLAGNPPLDPRTPVGSELLGRYWPLGEPALAIAGPNLTTEILVAAGRRNLLPISHAPEDDLIDSSLRRVRAAAARVPAGTLMLAMPPPPAGSTEPQFSTIQLVALGDLHRRFRFRALARSTSGLEVVRLLPRPQRGRGGPVR